MSKLNEATEDEWDKIQRRYYAGFINDDEQDELKPTTENDKSWDDFLEEVAVYGSSPHLRETTESATDRQEGGSHYMSKSIQPIEYILANQLDFCSGCVIKYITRYKDKGGLEDLKKAKHYIDFLIEDMENDL